MQLGAMKGGLAVTLAIAACGDNVPSVAIPDECNPLGGEGCLLPWPSSAYLSADSSAATGMRVTIPPQAMPSNSLGVAVDPSKLDRWDGFSPAGTILALFPKGVATDNLPLYDNFDASLAADSPIVLLDLDTGERAPFFAETDMNNSEPGQSALIIRPVVRLHTGAHYGVAIRNTVKSADGSELPISEAFAAMRDGKKFDHPLFAAVATNADQLFTALATMDVDKKDLALAWDFYTASDTFLQGDLLTMRNAAVTAIGDAGANLTFTAVEQTPPVGMYKLYNGTVKSPNFLSDGLSDDSFLMRGSDGLPIMSGMRDASWAAMIPECVTTQAGRHPAIVFGHGMLQSSSIILTDPNVQQIATENCAVIIAGDWLGFTQADEALLADGLTDLNVGYTIPDRLAQSVIDFISIENVLRGPMVTSQEFSYNGQPIIDPSRVSYIGESLGALMGNVVMSYDPNIQRAALGVAGGNWSIMVDRSFAWGKLGPLLTNSYRSPKAYEVLVSMFTMALEPYDPITTAAHIIKDPLPGTPAKNILMWYSVGDDVMPNLGTEMLAREMSIPLLEPATQETWHLASASGPLPSAVNVLNEHPTPLPDTSVNVPPQQTNATHATINLRASVHRAVEAFVQGSQMAVQTCYASDKVTPAACDCATGACD
jgi:hypothetical protein